MTIHPRHACVVGIGSPHGGDAVGWRTVERLRSLLPVGATAVALSDPTRLLPLLSDYSDVWIVDACRSDQAIGSITRFVWPDDRIDRRWCVSGHGIGLAEILELSEKLGRSAAATIVFSVNIGSETLVPNSEIADTLTDSVQQLSRVLRDEVTAVLQERAQRSVAWSDRDPPPVVATDWWA